MLLLDELKNCLNYKIRLPRICVCCEAIIFFRQPLCKICRRFLYTQFQINFDDVGELDDQNKTLIVSLWQWDESNSFMIQKVIVSLKDGHNPQLYNLFANWMMQKIKEFNLPIGLKVCAVPSFDRSHPQCLAKTFSLKLNSECLSILKKVKSKSQKNMGKSERQQVRFEKTAPNCANIPRRLVLIDDVVSTGASLKRCAEALKPAQIAYIIVWAEKI